MRGIGYCPTIGRYIRIGHKPPCIWHPRKFVKRFDELPELVASGGPMHGTEVCVTVAQTI